MASTVQKKAPSPQIPSLFHHSLIKIIILHQLEKKEVPWDVFISHPDFSTIPPVHISPTQPVHRPVPLSSRPTPRRLQITTEQSGQHEEEGHEQVEEEEDKHEETDEDQQHDFDGQGQQLEPQSEHEVETL